MTINSKIIDDILLCCGMGKTLYIGDNYLPALGLLLQKQCDAQAWTQSVDIKNQCDTYYPNRCIQGNTPFPTTNASPHVNILVIDHALDLFSRPILDKTLQEARSLTKNLVILASKTHVDGNLRDREWWEKLCIRNGFRRHPRGQKVKDYGRLNIESDTFTLYFESISQNALQAYSMDDLLKERDLHMDMLREAGRRSDAHLVRYHLATNYIRPGDTILDCACGLGYGSYILYQCSNAIKVLGIDLSPDSIQYATANYGIPDAVEYQVGDAQNLAQLPDNSVDFITSFETIEHLPDPLSYLSELARVLRPSGRILISVPNEWAIDPERAYPPYHCQEYTWDRFQQEVGEHFLLDKGFLQMCGGSGRWQNQARRIEEIPLGLPLAEDAEWVLLLGMADPLKGRDLPFLETTHTTQPDHPDYHATAYAKSYLNPWLAKGITTWPMHNREARIKLSLQILESYPEDSADYGAALCTLAYRYLEADTPARTIQDLLEKIEKYINLSTDIPHCIRWQISLRYVGACLYRKMGDFEQAQQWFSACFNMNPLSFSAMSATKIIDAGYHSALLSLARDNIAEARTCLETSITRGKELMTGSWFNIIGYDHAPVTFGLHDLTQTMDYLVRSGYALHQIPSWHERPAQALESSKGLFERILQSEKNTTRLWELDYQRLFENNLQLQKSQKKIEAINRLLPPGSIRQTLAKTIWRLFKRF